ncbi:MAG: tRNA uridine-5-carboxymethylaminomethyl(34) synthesis GTPase MnmE [Desulfococcaceae bacterium]
MQTDTIAAISTPPGGGGIGIIRVSGPEAVTAASVLFRRSGDAGCDPGEAAPVSDWESHRLCHGFIVEPESGRMIDEVLLAVMRAPRSYTREDVVEIQAHAGPAGLRAILDQLLRRGVRLAEPGEFTRRAFLNGRIDLSQAEGVMDLIAARSRNALDAASAQLAGDLRRRVEEIREVLREEMAAMEAAIDFPEEVGEELSPVALRERLEAEVRQPVSALVRRSEEGRMTREGVRVVVAGRPNVGKSSLVNRLLGQERAIVTEIPGTTRDVIEEQMSLQGMVLTLTDTAGLHETEDPVERIGVARAKERLAEADLVLLVTEAEAPPSPEELEIASASGSSPVIWVINKMDRIVSSAGMDGEKPPQEPPPLAWEIPPEWERFPRQPISARTGSGIHALVRRMAEAVEPSSGHLSHGAVPNLRHRGLLEAALERIETAISGIDVSLPFELIAIDLKEAYERLGDILGKTVREDVLDEIFGRFCIGK